MPTGYTAAIADGIKFNDFVLQCARAFGPLITMRDEPMDAPIPEKFEPTSWHLERVTEARKRQEELEAMSPALAELAADGAYRLALKKREGYIQEKNALAQKYEAMLEQVRAWTPPTADHQGLKDFMEQQIVDSIRFDCVVYGDAPKLQTGAEWLAEQMAAVKHDIEYHSKHHAEELERVNGRTEWVRALRESLR